MTLPPTVNLLGVAAIGLFLGPVALRQTVKALPGTMGSKWQLHRALSWGDGWLIHQTGEHSYDLKQIPAGEDSAEVNGETVDLTQLGHISTKTGSVPVGVSYGPGAVAKSPHVGVSPLDSPRKATDRRRTRVGRQLDTPRAGGPALRVPGVGRGVRDARTRDN